MEVKEILETYSGKNIIRDENLNDELKKLYSLALEYREKNLLTSEMVLTTKEELEKLEQRIEKLKSIGLGKSRNVRQLEEELESRKEVNSKMAVHAERTKFFAKISDRFRQQMMPGFLVMGFQDFAKFLAAKGYTHKALEDFEGELSENDIKIVENLVIQLNILNDVVKDIINCMRTTKGAGQFKDEDYKYGVLISIAEIVDHKRNKVGEDILKDNSLYFIGKDSFLRPEKLVTVEDLLDNDLYQVRFDDGYPNHNIGNLFDNGLPEDEMWLREKRLGITDLLIAESPNGEDNIIYQTYLDGVIIYHITGNELKFIDYGTVRVEE